MELILINLKAKGGDVLFPSVSLKYGNTVKITQKTLDELKSFGVNFDQCYQTNILTGIVPDRAKVNISGLLSDGSQVYPIYVIDRDDHIIGFWKNGRWFNSKSSNLAYVQKRFDQDLEFDSRPISLA